MSDALTQLQAGGVTVPASVRGAALPIVNGVIVVAVDCGNGQVHHLSNLAGDGGEHLARLRAMGYQRGHVA
jgi:hypothetical protein